MKNKMNNFVTILGVATVATLAGCKDPNYKPMAARSQYAVKPVQVEPAEAHCTCPAGTKHTEPCACGASDCKCTVVPVETTPVETTPAETTPAETKPTEPVEAEYTIYIVQRGDILGKIAKKYRVSIASIKELNHLKGDKIRLGQKLKLPGKIDVGEQTVPEGAFAKPKAPTKKPYEPYTGETTEYTVKSGDTLGAIAYGNGINIRQLKELNGLKKDNLKIGQKLKIPASGKSAATPPPAVEQPTEAPSTAPSEVSTEPSLPSSEPSQPPTPPSVAETTYIVQEGEDLMSVSIASGVSLSALRELNNLPEDAKLTAGQVLKIPAEE